jgi:Ser/Thr protein kinase RdoA (MazF antagonist)
VVWVGETVRRPCGPHSPFVHWLLHHLEQAGFEGAPRLLGIDEAGREILTFIEGDVPPELGLWTDEQLAAAADLIHRFHEATAGSALAGKEEVVCHYDLSPCNTVFRDGLPQALIDFDSVEPGPRAADLAYAAWLWLDYGNPDLPAAEQGRRLRLFCEAYGLERKAGFTQWIVEAQQRIITRFQLKADYDEYAVRAIRWTENCQAWVVKHRAALEAMLNG